MSIQSGRPSWVRVERFDGADFALISRMKEAAVEGLAPLRTVVIDQQRARVKLAVECLIREDGTFAYPFARLSDLMEWPGLQRVVAQCILERREYHLLRDVRWAEQILH